MNRTRYRQIAVIVFITTTLSAFADEQSPTEFLKSWASGWQTSDVDKMMSFYGDSEETIAIESTGQLRKGPASIRKMYQGAFDELVFERVTFTPDMLQQKEGVAWTNGRYKAEIQLKANGARYVMETRGSIVLKQEKDSWKIVLEHFSPIPDVPRIRPAGNPK